MINEQENKTSLTKLSPEEYEKNQVEMSRYRNNGLTYRLGLLGMGTSLFACLILPSSNSFLTLDELTFILSINIWRSKKEI